MATTSAGNIYEVNSEFHKAILARERAAAVEMVRQYGHVWTRIRAELDALKLQIEEARAAGVEVGPSWLFRQERYHRLLQQAEAEILKFTKVAGGAITLEQERAIEAAQAEADALMREALGPPPVPNVSATFTRLSRGAVQDLVGFSSDGSPLGKLLGELPGEAGQGVRKALITGVALGQNPRVIARECRKALGGNLARALTISRTEVLRAYREASHRTYEANADILEGWVWRSARGSRTCAACFAKDDGTVHPLEERLTDHPNGRCHPICRSRSWSDLLGPGFEDIPDTRPPLTTGADAFEKLSDADKQKVLGGAGFQAYKAGKVSLRDFGGTRSSKVWGTSPRVKSLKEILGKDEANAWMKKAAAEARAERQAALAAKKAAKAANQQIDVIGDVRITPERRQHWGARHPETTEGAERQMLARTIQQPEHEMRDPKDPAVVRRYARDADGKWWRAVIKTGEEGGDYVLTFHRVQKPGR